MNGVDPTPEGEGDILTSLSSLLADDYAGGDAEAFSTYGDDDNDDGGDAAAASASAALLPPPTQPAGHHLDYPPVPSSSSQQQQRLRLPPAAAPPAAHNALFKLLAFADLMNGTVELCQLGLLPAAAALPTARRLYSGLAPPQALNRYSEVLSLVAPWATAAAGAGGGGSSATSQALWEHNIHGVSALSRRVEDMRRDASGKRTEAAGGVPSADDFAGPLAPAVWTPQQLVDRVEAERSPLLPAGTLLRLRGVGGRRASRDVFLDVARMLAEGPVLLQHLQGQVGGGCGVGAAPLVGMNELCGVFEDLYGVAQPPLAAAATAVAAPPAAAAAQATLPDDFGLGFLGGGGGGCSAEAAAAAAAAAAMQPPPPPPQATAAVCARANRRTARIDVDDVAVRAPSGGSSTGGGDGVGGSDGGGGSGNGVSASPQTRAPRSRAGSGTRVTVRMEEEGAAAMHVNPFSAQAMLLSGGEAAAAAAAPAAPSPPAQQKQQEPPTTTSTTTTTPTPTESAKKKRSFGEFLSTGEGPPKPKRSRNMSLVARRGTPTPPPTRRSPSAPRTPPSAAPAAASGGSRSCSGGGGSGSSEVVPKVRPKPKPLLNVESVVGGEGSGDGAGGGASEDAPVAAPASAEGDCDGGDSFDGDPSATE